MQQDISYRNIFRIAMPIMASSVATNLITVADTAFLGRLSEAALGAAGNGGILYFLFVFVAAGLSTAGQIIIGRRNGEGNFAAIGSVFDHALLLLLAVALGFFAFLQFGTDLLLENIIQSAEVLSETDRFIGYRSLGIFFAIANLMFSAFYVGTTRTFILMPATAFTAVVNIVLDYGLIFGNLGMPAMGIEGAAIASVIAEAATTLLFLVYTLRLKDKGTFGLLQFKNLRWSNCVPILKLGGPIFIQNTLSMATWFSFFTMIEKLGVRELAISHIIRSIYMVMMIPTWGLCNASNTLTSNLIGQGAQQLVPRAVMRIVWIGLGSSLLFVPFNLIAPATIIGFFSPDEALIQQAIPALYVITASMFGFSAAFIVFFAVSGTGKTRISLLIEVVSILLYLAFVGYVVLYLRSSVQIAWCGEFVYFGIMGTLAALYLLKGNWRNTTV